ncbi:Tk [Drosophila busckii]|uniref:Tk n=1 Tax=Drosophila busckii TaxID=30019 RepID=A0A0M4F311_DROBS|nr:tachykinins [Drosophila busckii]ALC45912.1 Tk [Drosophila busckii]
MYQAVHNRRVLLLLLLITAIVFVRTTASLNVDSELLGNMSSLIKATSRNQLRNLEKHLPTFSFIVMKGGKKQETTSDTNCLDCYPLDYAEDVQCSDNQKINRLKKAPLSFVGVRGKKFLQDDYPRISDLLQTMENERVRENLARKFLEKLSINSENIVKRVPTGFTGMRGKRPSLLSELNDEEETFQQLGKRVPGSSFVGVRGKKDVSHQHYKRSILTELWRKLFTKAYDVRGKKQRSIDFNSKFVAVRGKKNQMKDGSNNKQYIWQPWPYLTGDKRVPNGFVGMRGKRPVIAE